MPTEPKPGAFRKAAARISRSVQEAEEERRKRRQLEADLKECKREHDDAHKTLNKEQSEFDKQLLTLSAGFLGLSLAFIKDVVPLKDAIQLWALYVGFVLLALCVFTVLLSFQFSVVGHFSLKAYWQKKQEYRSAPQDRQKKLDAELNTIREGIVKHDKRLKIVNRWVSGTLFSLGVVALVYFVIVNIHAAHVQPAPNAVTVSPLTQAPNPTPTQTPARPAPQPSSGRDTFKIHSLMMGVESRQIPCREGVTDA
jgi:hypothetical protein